MTALDIAYAVDALRYGDMTDLAAGIIAAAGNVELTHSYLLAGALDAWARGVTLSQDSFPPLKQEPKSPPADPPKRQVNLNSHKIRALTGLSSEEFTEVARMSEMEFDAWHSARRAAEREANV